jgi:DNA-binding transcriptional MerR regulator/methylmalonyl-CoA mutase cobalamin-binding subunit
MQDMPITAYSNDPVYNMKAVTQRTGIPAATLRAWERRYHALAPQRSDGNYRLYSERDVAILRWLQAQLDAGLSISRAVALLERLRVRETEQSNSMPVVQTGNGHSAADERIETKAAGMIANWNQLSTALYEALVTMDEQHAAVVMAEAFAMHSLEDVCTHLITPALVMIGEEWHNQRITVVQERYASTYLMGRLLGLFNSLELMKGPLVLVGCVPSDQHSIGALMLALLLRRTGHNVRFIGPNLPLADLVKTIMDMRPHVVALSAVMSNAIDPLIELSHRLRDAGVNSHLVYGGSAFANEEVPNAALYQHLDANADYIGTDLAKGLLAIDHLLSLEPRRAII